MKTRINRRKGSRYLDRRSGEDRRKVYSLNYFIKGGTERRTPVDRRRILDRRYRTVIHPHRRGPTLV